MTLTPYLLVLISAFTHAWWNYLFKRSGGGQLFIGLSKIGEVVLFAPVFLLFSWGDAATHAATLWPLAVVGAVLTMTNYVLLAVAYRKGELSLVYPVSRGGVLLFIPILGYLAFGERVGVIGIVAFLLILAGITALQLPKLNLSSVFNFTRHLTRDPAAGFALLAAAAAAGYTVWDKHAVSEMKPFTYFYSYTALVALMYAAHLLRSDGIAAIKTELRARGGAIVAVAVLNTVTYLLVLLALQSGTSSYVIALRQLSVAFGALLGWSLLREPFGPPRRVGVLLIVVGSILVGLAG